MNFIKESFYILTLPQYGDKPEKREGYVDETRTFGFHKFDGGWSATDLASGRQITWQPTRKACVEYIESNMEKIMNKKNSDIMKRHSFLFKSKVSALED